MRYIAAQNFVAQDDGFNGYDGMNNFYFYRLEDSTRHVFIAWDEDNAFLSPRFLITTRLDENVLTRKTLELPAFQAAYYQLAAGSGDVGQRLDAAGDAAAVRDDCRRDAGRHQQALLERRPRRRA